MKLLILGSGSLGNCYYLLPKKGKGILLECGLNYQEIKKGINFDIENIDGCLLTHEHKDHCKSAQQLINSGINVYTSAGTINALKLNNATMVIKHEIFQIGEFMIKPFATIHDCIEPFGYLISHPEMGVMCFATDTKDIEYTFCGINQWLIEANYSEEYMLNQLISDKLNAFLAHRITQNHMSLETCMNFYEKQETESTNNIILCHLSEHNSSGIIFQDKWSREFGIKPIIAKKGIEIHL